MVRVAIVGLGKMGLSHLAIIRAHPQVELAGVCDNAGYLLDVIQKYTSAKCFTKLETMLDEARPDALCIATPSRLHADMVRAALDRGIHVFCEKPFCLDPQQGQTLAALALEKNLVNQVGYHYRFVAAYEEARKLLLLNAIGKVHHAKVDAYGPVVLKPQSATWRSSKAEGGGCLYDYACHGVDLVNYLFGAPARVSGTVLNQVFSTDVDDEVYSTLHFDDGKTVQINANWSDASVRKMTTGVTAWGSNGKLYADRQELRVYLRKPVDDADWLRPGWNCRYITDLDTDVWYYLRGEEYSAQIDHFIATVAAAKAGVAVAQTRSPFASALQTDQVVGLMLQDAAHAGPAQKKPGIPSGLRSRWAAFTRLANS